MKHRNIINHKAFTLIELLIVVLVIGILAGIAIPNFLNAQVRAKVASMRDSQRTLTIGLESYYVDYNSYPPGLNPFIRPDVIVQTWRLSTPIPYLNEIPQDIFYSPQSFGQLGGIFGPGGPYIKYIADPIVTEVWILWSYGPDKDMEFIQEDYDPTNGILSSGDIYRVGALP